MFRISRISLSVLAIAAAAIALHVGDAGAQAPDYPNRPVRIIGPFAPGASGDLTARLLADFLEKRWSQPFIVENKVGAAGLIGANELKRSAPDGYTLMLGYDSMTTFSVFVKDNSFDPAKDVTPVSVLVRFPLVLVTSTAFAPTTLAELIAYAKANPGKVNLAAQTNSPAHLTSLLFMKKAGVDVALVPYAAAAALTQSVLTNETHGTFGAWGPFRPHVAGGKVRAIAVAAPARLKDLPNVPTLKESGIDASWTVWYALFAPAGTPAPVVGKLAAASAEFVKVPTVIEQFNKLSMEVVSSTPAELARTIAEDTAARAEAARLGNVQPQ